MDLDEGDINSEFSSALATSWALGIFAIRFFAVGFYAVGIFAVRFFRRTKFLPYGFFRRTITLYIYIYILTHYTLISMLGKFILDTVTVIPGESGHINM